MKKIAVILVNYNGLDDSLECIESIQRSDCSSEVTVIFVDNASKVDEASAIKDRFDDVVAIRNTENRGFSAGNNIGIKYALSANFEYIMLLNNDTIIEQQMITKLKVQCEKEVVTVPKMLYYTEPEKIWYGGGEINRWTGNAKHKRMNQVNESSEEEFVTFATGCCMMFHSETLKKVGFLDESYFMYCEDIEYCIRLMKNEIKIKYIPSAKLWHKVSSSTGGERSPFNTYYITRNRLNYVKKYKNEFHRTAYPFSLLSRYIRLWMESDNNVKKAFERGIADHKNGKVGKK